MNKRRISNEEIAKVLVEFLDAHINKMTQNIQKMEEVSTQIEHRIQEAKQLKFELNIAPIKREFDSFSEKALWSVEAVKKTLRKPNFLWYTMAVMAVLVLACIGVLYFVFTRIY